jgi:succinate dehydrogenase/fumarate reductase-like Fe-S protein
VRFFYNGQPTQAIEGQTVAAALLSMNQRILRKTPRRHEPRGLLCGMGVCFDCLMRIDDRPNQQACLTLIADGMRVETQAGNGGRSDQQ